MIGFADISTQFIRHLCAAGTVIGAQHPGRRHIIKIPPGIFKHHQPFPTAGDPQFIIPAGQRSAVEAVFISGFDKIGVVQV